MSEPARPRVLFAGLGAMGAPMIRRVAAAGLPVRPYDIDDARTHTVAAELGLPPVRDPAAAAADTDVLLLMLPDSDAVEAALGDPADAASVLARLPHGALVLDMGSSRPSSTVALAAAATARGLGYVDAPVSGGVARARTGELAIMVGGADADAARAAPVLAALGTSITRTGGPGSGHAMKALNNLLSAVGLTAAAEVFAVGRKFGIETSAMLDVINHATGRNQATEVKYPNHVVNRAFDSGFALRLMAKDVAIALDLAREHGASVPIAAAAVQQVIGAMAMLDDPGADHTEVVKYVERNTGTRL